MLVLTRKPGESIIMDGGIKIMVCEVRGDRVRLGIEAPQDKKIHREEVWIKNEEKKNSNRE